MPRFDGLESTAQRRSADLGAFRRAGGMFLRALLRKPFLGSSGGLLFIGRGTRVTGLRNIRHSGRLVIEDGAEVQGLARRGLVFGDQVSVGPRSAIRPSSYYGGPVGEGLRVGDRSSFATGCFIGCSGFISIGDDVMLGPGVQLHAENHAFADPDRPIKEQGVARTFITIEDDCWIGAGTIVTAGVTIGRGSVVGAGSVVTRDIPAGSIAAGAPARVIRRRDADQPTDARATRHGPGD
jgi:acetyltransferase-like isoleucine patch superfamily enzyme